MQMRTGRARAGILRTAILLAVVASAVPALARPPETSMAVTGVGVVEHSPDMARVTIGVTTPGETAAEALAANSEAMRRVVDRLREAGLADEDIQTSGFSVTPQWDNNRIDKEPRLAGFVARNGVNARVRALDGLGAVLDAAVADGANTLGGIDFGLADATEALDEARRAAVADAMRRAEVLAGAAGVELGALRSIREDEGGGARPMFAARAMDAGAVPVEPGAVSHQARVTIVWDLLAAGEEAAVRDERAAPRDQMRERMRERMRGHGPRSDGHRGNWRSDEPRER